MVADNVQDFFEHFGVKGMHWGVRKRSSSNGASSSPASKTAHLSNDELRKVVERMRLDQQYSELSKGATKKKVFDGQDFAKKAVERIGGTVVTAGIAVGSAAIAKAFTKKLALRAAKKTVETAVRNSFGG